MTYKLYRLIVRKLRYMIFYNEMFEYNTIKNPSLITA